MVWPLPHLSLQFEPSISRKPKAFPSVPNEREKIIPLSPAPRDVIERRTVHKGGGGGGGGPEWKSVCIHTVLLWKGGRGGAQGEGGAVIDFPFALMTPAVPFRRSKLRLKGPEFRDVAPARFN